MSSSPHRTGGDAFRSFLSDGTNTSDRFAHFLTGTLSGVLGLGSIADSFHKLESLGICVRTAEPGCPEGVYRPSLFSRDRQTG